VLRGFDLHPLAVVPGRSGERHAAESTRPCDPPPEGSARL
jgi:hypothetical protein